MNHNLIRYQFKVGTRDEWHRQVAEFIAALDTDPDLKGKISYRCLRERDGSGYYHLAAAATPEAARALQGKEFFRRYQAETRRVGGGEVEVSPLEVVAETAFRA